MPYKPIEDIAGANSAIADIYGRADAALKALANQTTVTWDTLQGKPAAFPASTHTHDWASVTGKPSTYSATLGETSATAYRGDRGKTAYDHSAATGNPHGATPADIGAATSSHTHSYLPLTGGTLSGSLATASGITIGGALHLDNDNTNYKSIYFRMGGLSRWHFYATSDPENTSDNAGTNLVLRRFNNAGGYLSEVFAVNRIDGIVRFAYTPYAAGNVMYHAGNFAPTNIPTQTETLTISNGTYNGAHLVLGTYHLWISSGKLYIKSGAPTSATDGTVVGAQT